MKSAANIFLSIFSFALFFSGGSSHPKKQRAVGIAFYNVENLFDTLDDKSINDNEFLPNGEKKWNTEKYNAKLSRIADALNSISHELPAFVGFAEVENHKVLEDLATVKLLNRAKYKIVHFDSPDTRGIDVGFFYSKKKVKSVNALSIPVNTGAENRPTRDILLVECALKKGPQVYFFINHWPSRYGGQEKTEPKRISASHTLARHVDSLFSIDPKAIIIAMGDFNDYPENHSIQDILIGQRNSKLINLMETAISEYPGSYSYKNESEGWYAGRY